MTTDRSNDRIDARHTSSPLPENTMGGDRNDVDQSPVTHSGPVNTHSAAPSAWTAINHVPKPRASEDENALRIDQHVDDDFDDSTGRVDRTGTDLVSSEDIEGHSAKLDAAEDERIEDPHDIYEDIGIDRKYFDPEYFRRYHGVGSIKGTVQRVAPGSKSFRYIVSDYVRPGDIETSSGQQKADAEMVMAATDDSSGDEEVDDPQIPNAIAKGTQKPKRGRMFGFHDDEEAWLMIFHEKIKLAINNGIDVEMPIDPLIHKFFDRFFEGKVLKDADGNLLPPRVSRSSGTVYNHLRARGPMALIASHNEVLTLLENSTGGQLYVPAVTDEEIQQYRSDGTVVLDDINDQAKNLALALPEKEIRRNEQLRSQANKKRKAGAQDPASSSSEEASSPAKAKKGHGEPFVSKDTPSSPSFSRTLTTQTAHNISAGDNASMDVTFGDDALASTHLEDDDSANLATATNIPTTTLITSVTRTWRPIGREDSLQS